MREDWWGHGRPWNFQRSAYRGRPFPWLGWGRFFGAGELRLALLSLLADGPKHGYELMKKLEERSNGVYRSSAGSVYPILQQLEDEGLTVSGQNEGKRVYRLTPEGEAELEREKATVNKIWQRAEHWGEWGPWVPEMAIIARPIGRLFRAARRALAGTDDTARIVQVREIIERAIHEIEALEPNPGQSS
jgi:DNA-binding PadR family transcriptional regulator